MFSSRTLIPQPAQSDGSFNSCVVYDGVGVGAAQGIGARDEQEDALLVEALSEDTHLLESLSDDEMTQLLKQSCHTLNQFIKEHEDTFQQRDSFGAVKQAGAAGLFALILPSRRYWLINLGDCCAYAITQERTQMTLLNTQHRPNACVENQRLKEGNFAVFGNRLGGVLGLSRAFGYHKALEFGLSHEPEIVKGILPKKGHILLASDGLMEGEQFNHQDLLASLKGGDSLSFKCQQLIHQAYAFGSHDNVSILLANCQELSQPHEAYLLGVFDGFNGNSVAQYCAQQLKTTLRNGLMQYKWKPSSAIIFSNFNHGEPSAKDCHKALGRLTMI